MKLFDQTIHVGDYVKIYRPGETFWVRVRYIDHIRLCVHGIVRNELVGFHLHGLRENDPIVVPMDEILQVDILSLDELRRERVIDILVDAP